MRSEINRLHQHKTAIPFARSQIMVQLLIAGTDRSASGGEFDVINPLTGKAVWTVPSAGAAELDEALNDLAAFQPEWERVPPSQKRAVFLKAANLVMTKKYHDLIAEYMTKETAASTGWQHVNQVASAGLLREAAGLASHIRGEHHKSEKPDVDMFVVQRRAAGVVFAIAPWNAPINLALRAIAIPLICGNTVLLRCSEYSPASQRMVVDLLLEAGLPPRALAFVSMSRDDAAKHTNRVIARREVRRINFTGSDVVGKLIAAECGRNLKQCILELGGKAPVIVSEHAKDNLESAAWGVVFGALVHSGQVCMGTERVLVHESILPEFERLVTERVSKLRAGDTKDAQLGPLFRPSAADTVTKQIQDAVQKGARVLVGDKSPQPSGDFATIVAPTVLSGISTSMDIWERESFGPTISITCFKTMDEAVTLANDSEYSLIAGLWTSNLHEAMKYAPQLRAGSVQVNGSTIHIEPSFGNAGLGGATGYGRFNIDSFTDLRSIAFHGPGGKFPMF